MRVEIQIGGFLLEIIDSNTTKVTVVFNCDPKVPAPYAIINFFCGQFLNYFLKSLTDFASFKGKKSEEFLQRMENNPKFYQRIKDKCNSIQNKHQSKMST